MTEVVKLGPYSKPVSVNMMPGDQLAVSVERDYVKYKLDPVRFSVMVDERDYREAMPGTIEAIKSNIASKLAKELLAKNLVKITDSERHTYDNGITLHFELNIAKEII
jgi:hypothetical protein